MPAVARRPARFRRHLATVLALLALVAAPARAAETPPAETPPAETPPAASPAAGTPLLTSAPTGRPPLPAPARAALKADANALLEAYGRDDLAAVRRLVPGLADRLEAIENWAAVRAVHVAHAAALADAGDARAAWRAYVRATIATVLASPADTGALFEAAFRLALFAHDAGDAAGRDAAVAWALELMRRPDFAGADQVPNLIALAGFADAGAGRPERAAARLAALAGLGEARQQLIGPAALRDLRDRLATALAGPPAACPASPAGVAVEAACLRRVDRLLGDGSDAEAGALLAATLAPPPVSASAAAPDDLLGLRAEAAELALRRDGWTQATVDRFADLGHRHAGRHDAGAMAVVALRLAVADLAAGRSSVRSIEVFGHVARRFVRLGDFEAGSATLALMARLADTEFTLVRRERPSPPADAAVKRATLAAMVRLDRAALADRRGLATFAAWLRDGPVAFAAALPQSQWGLVISVTEPYSAGEVGFSYPSEATAAELWGLLASRRPPDDLLHFGDRLFAANGERLIRENPRRSMALLEALLADMRARPALTGEQHRQLLMTLQALGQGATELGDPRAAARWRREAYDLARALPGEENLLVELMLEMRADARAAGDRLLARRLLAEADALRKAGADISIANIGSLDEGLAIDEFNRGARAQGVARMRRSFAALTNQPNATAGGLALRAAALARLEAASGNLDAARKLYDEFILPHYGNAARFGDLTALETRLDLLRLEARYGPVAATVDKLRGLRRDASRLVPGARGFHQSVEAAAALAELAAGTPREALAAAREALALEAPDIDPASVETDRLLRETLIEAAWASRPAATGARPGAQTPSASFSR